MTARTIDYADRGVVTIVENSDDLALTAAKIFAATVNEASMNGRSALIALSGGSTPKRMGLLLAGEPFRSEVDWSAVEIFWGDERSVPVDDEQSNAGEAIRGFLTEVGVPRRQLHPWNATDSNLNAAAMAYADELRIVARTAGVPRFDLVFLGMGDDGHTLSLFPGTNAIDERDRIAAANWVEKLGTTRLTLTAPLVDNAHRVVFLVAGSGKADTLHRVLDGDVDIAALPSQVIRPTAGTLTWLVDASAAARLDRV